MTARHARSDVPMLGDPLLVSELLARFPLVVSRAAIAVRTEDQRAADWWARQYARAADTVRIPRVLA